MKHIALYLLLLLLTTVFSARTSVWAENSTTVIHGKWDRGLLDKIYLYRMANGTLEELASSAIADDGDFNFICKPAKQGDFFYIGKNRLPEDRYAFYLKAGDVLDFTINDSSYALNGNGNSPENRELTRWHDFVLEMEAKSVYFMKNLSTYVDFFPLLEQKLKDLENYPESMTGNPVFDKNFEQYKNLNLLDITVSYLFKPRAAFPEGEDFPDYYRNLDLADITTTTELLNYPDGIALIDRILMYKKLWIERAGINPIEGFLTEIGSIPNDTIKGEFALQYAQRQQTLVGLNDFENRYGKYLITDSQKHRLKNMKKAFPVMAENTPASDFSFPDITGKKVSLSSFKGKAVYIDFWATWCAPCIREIPFLQKLEADYQGKDIVFMSVSFDASKDKTKWKDFVTSKEMKGIQLFAGDEGKTELSEAYKILAIPRFVLVGKDGNIVNSDAPRPSSTELRLLLDSLLK
ncbi:MAG: TlpA family protein disulfide reductase [Dysgonamonadaceae bacterium]|jgi:thiol-disulfide isomerase/thioredoxin|nr:TlpA family protein disulfide reductase [Dysgonamonadaceae bacterium]